MDFQEANTIVELHLIDTPGQAVFNQNEIFKTKSCENSAAAVFIYDMSSHKSFQSCSKFLSTFRTITGGKMIPGIVIANKSDSKEIGAVEVPTEEGREFAAKNRLIYFECSALRNLHVDQPFNYVAKSFYRRYMEKVA